MNNKVNSILDSLIEILSSITYNSTLFVNSKFKVIEMAHIHQFIL